MTVDTNSLRSISRDDRARTAVCRLRTAKDRFKENYNIGLDDGIYLEVIGYPNVLGITISHDLS